MAPHRVRVARCCIWRILRLVIFSLDENTQKRMRGEAGTALSREAIIELPAEFTLTDYTPIFVIPPALSEKEQHVRHLVLDVKLDVRDSAVQTQLNRACQGMRLMSSRFSKLESFFVSLCFGNGKLNTNAKSFAAKTLDIRNQTSWKTIKILRTSLVGVLHILRARGPGGRKFIRFLDQCGHLRTGLLHAGPIVRLPIYVAPEKQDSSSEADALDEASDSMTAADQVIAEQVLEQAYYYHRDIAPRQKKGAGANEMESLLLQSRPGKS